MNQDFVREDQLLDHLAEILFEIYQHEECVKQQHAPKECSKCKNVILESKYKD